MFLFEQTNICSVHNSSTLAAGMIQISNATNMILDMQGGFKTEERGEMEVKVR